MIFRAERSTTCSTQACRSVLRVEPCVSLCSCVCLCIYCARIFRHTHTHGSICVHVFQSPTIVVGRFGARLFAYAWRICDRNIRNINWHCVWPVNGTLWRCEDAVSFCGHVRAQHFAVDTCSIGLFRRRQRRLGRAKQSTRPRALVNRP